ncbi:hypothetical protein DLAC_10409 [Tieghemostelium lacteum]|uniref:Uncharacterized protein n=1 Tax=Tieghemostelium lacteum TaxID=361077 RepID=A0A151Z5A9_TIELA|nr:hypothetical protein DLAC_10409 [Tieghemostelium lacteum]|eukprot:KYQ89163.1 hypothetical protein DLAC_10409 [Tieghemostelium lacteum]
MSSNNNNNININNSNGSSNSSGSSSGETPSQQAPVVVQQNWKFKTQNPTDFSSGSGRRKRRNSEPGLMVQRSYKNFITHWKLDTKKPSANTPSSTSSSSTPSSSKPPHQPQQQSQQQPQQQPQQYLVPQQQQQQQQPNNSNYGSPTQPSQKISPKINSVPGSPHLFPSPSSAFKPVNHITTTSQQQQQPLSTSPNSNIINLSSNSNNIYNSNSIYNSNNVNEQQQQQQPSTSHLPHGYNLQRKHSLGDSGEQYKFHPYKSSNNPNFNSNSSNISECNINNNNNCTDLDIIEDVHHQQQQQQQSLSPSHLTPLHPTGPGYSRLSQRRISLPILSANKPIYDSYHNTERVYYAGGNNINSNNSNNSNSNSNQHGVTVHQQPFQSSSPSGDYQLPPLRKFDLQFPSFKFSNSLYKDIDQQQQQLRTSSGGSSSTTTTTQHHGHDKKMKLSPKIPNNNSSLGTSTAPIILGEVYDTNSNDYDEYSNDENGSGDVYNTNSNYYGNYPPQQQQQYQPPPPSSFQQTINNFKFEKLTSSGNSINLTSSQDDDLAPSKKLPSIQSLLSDVNEVSISDASTPSLKISNGSKMSLDYLK